jgi:hypothetical protein
LQAGLVKRARERLTAKIHGFLDENPVRQAEVGQRGIALQRKDQVAAVDLGAGVQLPNDVFIIPEIGNTDEKVGELSLGIAMGRQRTEYSGDDAHRSHSLGDEALGRMVRPDRFKLQV